eukprot:TRINITY_DN9359_c0_g1_i1.p1 TRINITY_DN9359_c0_g1~~TRINITY_DN9359_c0_g1_i1.p1  ORF type:complete len:615 (+),score=105.85 TRINITY_DN9359_c0_g1_i1:38-1882(+)
MADAAPLKFPGAPKQNGVSDRIKTMQVGQFGANLAAMLQMQNQVTASKAKIPEGAVKMPMPRMAARGEKMISFTVEAGKGSSVTLKYSDSTSVNDVLNEAQTQLSLKKDAERLGLYNANTGVFLRGELSLKMHLIKDEDKLEIKSRKDKGTFVKVFHRGKDEMELVEIYPSTTTIGLIQLLGNKDPDTADQFGLYLSNGTRLENDLKLSSVIKGTATVILEYRPSNMQVVGAPNLPPPPPLGAIPSSKSNPNLLPPPPPMANIPPPPLDSSDETPDTSSEKKKKLKMSAKNQKDKGKKVGKKGIPEDAEADKVPPLRFEVVQQLVAYLDAKGIEEVGLFRESAPLTEVKKLYAQFFNDKLDMSQVFDPHVAAGALKLYFREQSEALIPPSTCQEYSEAAKAGQDNSVLITIIKEQFLPRLPQPNKSILHILLNLLSKLVKNEEKNRMNPNAIAICFAPTIIFDRNAVQTTSMLEFEASKWTVPFIVRLVENYEVIYAGMQLPTAPTSPLRSSSSSTDSPKPSRRNSSPPIPNVATTAIVLPPPPVMDMSSTLPPPPKMGMISPRKQPPEPVSPRRNVTSMELPSMNSPKNHSPKGGKRQCPLTCRESQVRWYEL